MARMSGSDRRVSLHDVAAHAQVAVSTVSRYLNGALQLSPETEARVLRAMEAVGYTRSVSTPRGPARPRGVLGLVVPQIGNAYFARIAEQFVTAAEGHGYQALIASTSSHARKQNDYVELLRDKNLDGLVYVGNFGSNKALSALIEDGLPVVLLDEALSATPAVDAVLVDDYSGAYQATAHLTALGHQRIALLTGPPALRSVQERRRGWADALERAGIDPAAQIAFSGSFTGEFGAGSLTHLLAATPAPTAVFAASDAIAIGLMTGARTLGVRIPADLSVVGFDDVPAASYVQPRLTTVHTPLEVMAARAVTALIDRIDHLDRPPAMEKTPVTLVIGGTTAAPA
ncbi:LacI family transcriptional regulator [Streptomyces sp. NBC_01622]|uniref:LacI family DNA-binding transcriptional regulator n=1 Tax=Streptomyces sp. NBC_01622 TaxID=2975903 RepID=UPI0038666EC5|nr:LacI family transcriptional regulator [Streptomyces sp. NBC_01622]